MKKILLLFLVPCFAIANDYELITKKVTVFLAGAQISAQAKIQLKEGNNELIFSNLSPNINANSIQVRGLNKASINSIQFDVTFLQQQKVSAELKDLKSQIELLKDQISLKESRISGLEAEKSVMIQNKKLNSNEANSNLTQLKNYAAYYRQRSEEINNQLYLLKKERDEFQIEIGSIQREINKLEGRNRKSRGQIKLVLNSEISQSSSLEITYLVNDAGWNPSYELRAKNTKSPVNFLYQANIYQNTGDDWKDVDLTLSTADPIQRGQKPTLLPYFLNFNRPVQRSLSLNRASNYKYNPNVNEVRGLVTDSYGTPLPGVDIQLIGTNTRTQTDFDGKYNIGIPKNAKELEFRYLGYQNERLPVYAQQINLRMQASSEQLNDVVVSAYGGIMKKQLNTAVSKIQKIEQLSVMSFQLPKKYSIQSNEEPLKVKLDQQNLDAEFEYYVAPVLDPTVYLTCTLKDWQTLDLLPGEASIYFEDTYVSVIFIDANASADEFLISLGSDQNIVAERKQVNKMKSKSFFRSNQIVEKEFEISLRNNKNTNIEVKLEDRLPISQNSDIKVSDETYDGAKLEKDTGILTWNVVLEAKAKKTHKFSYKVTFPKGERVNLER
ncbi:DUF4139 domain-containing protein [Psychroflexus maritimus]|uniref:Mucoidy inhibitor MuiA family protein n=1 Tax=Psychroflexus maritimus TaxID=2714865 RepID=A0A967AB04_9FLAO|nr:DUF4139 domain-containing protein [Psychroflexus maritimus]NGZ88932.1 mucoidy inhibitor MuiA family protein [Psychroflexus maritimus]